PTRARNIPPTAKSVYPIGISGGQDAAARSEQELEDTQNRCRENPSKGYLVHITEVWSMCGRLFAAFEKLRIGKVSR
ncbi:MAG: hypothetical protein WBM71_07325, partial [Sedimenticolaceae bacterium]